MKPIKAAELDKQCSLLTKEFRSGVGNSCVKAIYQQESLHNFDTVTVQPIQSATRSDH